MKLKAIIQLFIILFCTFAMLISVSFAGTSGKIAGHIRDADSKEPLPGVNVVIEGTMMGAATDLEGYYVILNVPPQIRCIRIYDRLSKVRC